MVSMLERILKSISADFVTTGIILLIIVIFTVAVYYNFKREKEKFTNYVPVLLTSVGILGTFFGISIGLIHFDTNNIDGSIAALLGGMKTAFLTSLFGMAFSLLFKITQSLSYDQDADEDINDINLIDIYYNMNQQQENLKNLITAIGGTVDTSILSQLKLLRTDINDHNKISQQHQQEIHKDIQNIEEVFNDQQEGLQNLATTIGGDTDTSILSQVKLLRTDINDHNTINQQAQQNMYAEMLNIDERFNSHQEIFTEFSDRLWVKLQEFADILSKSATEAIIDALRQVIFDFNTNLTDQFGDNFKELNNAVKDLVTWQENYKVQISQMTEQYTLSVAAISSTEGSIKVISEKTEIIPSYMDKLSNIIEVSQHQLNQLELHLAAFHEMREKAVQAVPIINGQIENTLKSMSDAVDSTSDHYKHLIKETSTLQEHITKNIENMQQRLDATLQEVFSNQTQNMQKVFANIETGLTSQVGKTGAAVEKQLGMLDQSMSEELNRVMNAMGKALGQISNQFTSDYSKLVAQMQDIVSKYRN